MNRHEASNYVEIRQCILYTCLIVSNCVVCCSFLSNILKRDSFFDIIIYNSTHLISFKKTQGGGEKVVEKKLHKNVVNNSVGVGMLKIVKCCWKMWICFVSIFKLKCRFICKENFHGNLKSILYT